MSTYNVEALYGEKTLQFPEGAPGFRQVLRAITTGQSLSDVARFAAGIERLSIEERGDCVFTIRVTKTL